MDTQIQSFVISAHPGGDVGRDRGIPGNLQASLLPDLKQCAVKETLSPAKWKEGPAHKVVL